MICESCGRDTEKGEKHRPTLPIPRIAQLEDMEEEGNYIATDGCDVEPDGMCPHGHVSWLIALGLI